MQANPKIKAPLAREKLKSLILNDVSMAFANTAAAVFQQNEYITNKVAINLTIEPYILFCISLVPL